jgi:hypothetical protein
MTAPVAPGPGLVMAGRIALGVLALAALPGFLAAVADILDA